MPEPEEEEQLFQKQVGCTACHEPIEPGDNWGCLECLVGDGIVIFGHFHLHLRCTEGDANRIRIIRSLGFKRLYSGLLGSGLN